MERQTHQVRKATQEDKEKIEPLGHEEMLGFSHAKEAQPECKAPVRKQQKTHSGDIIYTKDLSS